MDYNQAGLELIWQQSYRRERPFQIVNCNNLLNQCTWIALLLFLLSRIERACLHTILFLIQHTCTQKLTVIAIEILAAHDLFLSKLIVALVYVWSGSPSQTAAHSQFLPTSHLITHEPRSQSASTKAIVSLVACSTGSSGLRDQLTTDCGAFEVKVH